MAHKFINEIGPGQTIDDIYMVKEPILRSTTQRRFIYSDVPLRPNGAIERADVAGDRDRL